MYHAFGILLGVIAIGLLVPSWRYGLRLIWTVTCTLLTMYCFVRGVSPDYVPGGRYDTIFDQLVYGAFGVFWAGFAGLLIFDFILWRREVNAKKCSH
mgnify:CR=1